MFPPTFFPSLSISLSLRLKLHSLSFTGDNWLVECQTDAWKRGESVQLKHVDTSMPVLLVSTPPPPPFPFPPFRLALICSYIHTHCACLLIPLPADAYLYAKKSDMFNDQNCRNCPIVGQLEISAYNNRNPSDKFAQWQTAEGIYFPSPKATP